MLFGAAGSNVLYHHTSADEEPEKEVILYSVGFVTCLFWMFVTAQEVVRVIKTLGSFLKARSISKMRSTCSVPSEMARRG